MTNETLTMDERGDNYAKNTNLDHNTYKGDIVTAYVVGCMEQEVINKKEIDRLMQIIDLKNEIIDLQKSQIKDYKLTINLSSNL